MSNLERETRIGFLIFVVRIICGKNHDAENAWIRFLCCNWNVWSDTFVLERLALKFHIRMYRSAVVHQNIRSDILTFECPERHFNFKKNT